jgi:hypothetical protein
MGGGTSHTRARVLFSFHPSRRCDWCSREADGEGRGPRREHTYTRFRAVIGRTGGSWRALAVSTEVGERAR